MVDIKKQNLLRIKRDLSFNLLFFTLFYSPFHNLLQVTVKYQLKAVCAHQILYSFLTFLSIILIYSSLELPGK